MFRIYASCKESEEQAFHKKTLSKQHRWSVRNVINVVARTESKLPEGRPYSSNTTHRNVRWPFERTVWSGLQRCLKVWIALGTTNGSGHNCGIICYEVTHDVESRPG